MKKATVKTIILVIALVGLLAVSGCALAACGENVENKIEITAFEENKVYELDASNTNFMGNDGALVSMVALMLFDEEKTYFEFKSDGTVHGQIATKAGLFGGIKDLLASFDMSEDDLKNMLKGIDLAEGLEFYAEPMFPGFTKNLVEGNIDKSFELIERSLGMNISGVDFTTGALHDAVVAMGREYTEKGTLHLPENLLDIIPADAQLILTADWGYSLMTLEGSDGTTHEAIYIGGPVAQEPETTQPFAIFSLGTGDDGTPNMHLVIEFMNIDLALKLRTSEQAA